ncbi:hypothetical protein FDG72_gp120 [Klebsiella phage PMBT1]|uniref:Uncharacterized protein n=1 Tax=Klebsiella phage PMBT1 TaxID=1880822 RepID=A0A1G4GQI9_9CAUD|nr:hypothetical protein FDG72_gp120 [Klebsiella phage PMBT1]SCO64813.1 hypothetical protein [Klebsiella phage PMBT1]
MKIVHRSISELSQAEKCKFISNSMICVKVMPKLPVNMG